MARSAQLTPFFTKFRSSVAARSMSAKLVRNRLSGAALSCRASAASSANAARFSNSGRRRAQRPTIVQACGVRSNR